MLSGSSNNIEGELDTRTLTECGRALLLVTLVSSKPSLECRPP